MERDQLKFITCGSVDDGKSTLIGHLLYEAKLIFSDQEQSLVLDSQLGSREGELDYSLLLDGLSAEREQGITIDVAYRFFKTEKRSFIVADCPGHLQYTRNMAVGASFADLALIIVDASKKLSPQTKRHLYICTMMGIQDFIFAVNKMDLIDYDEKSFKKIQQEIQEILLLIKVHQAIIMPVSAVVGDNLVVPSPNMPWYQGAPLKQVLDDIQVFADTPKNDFYLPVQRVSRPNHLFRGFQGQVASGTLSVGDEIVVLPSVEKTHIAHLYNTDTEVQTISQGEAITLQTTEEVDISRGSILYAGENPPEYENLFTAQILWTGDEPLFPERSYTLKSATKMVIARVVQIKYQIEIQTGTKIAVNSVQKNEIAVCDFALSKAIPFTNFEQNQTLGSFILIDRLKNFTVAAGTISHGLRRSKNLVWQETEITREIRSKEYGQSPLTIWFTGLSGSGKSTLANALEKRLFFENKYTMLLDGDNIRQGLNQDLGFEESDRIENLRRVAEVSKLMNDAGLIVLTAFISPYEADRQQARSIVGSSFVEVFVDTPIEECEKRDIKGLYKKAKEGMIPNFTGITAPYEKPENPDITLCTQGLSVEKACDELLEKLEPWIEKEYS